MYDLTVTPDSYNFHPHELADLHEILADMDKYTIVTSVASVRDLALNESTGRTSDSYAYTESAFQQLGTLLAPGLAPMAIELSGRWRQPGEDRRSYSAEMAVNILTSIIKLRFDKRLLGLQLVKNRKTKTIDGIVGMRYRYLSNQDFLDRTIQALKEVSANFTAAYLYGRQLVVRFKHDASDYSLAGEPYSYGFHFANSEIGGKSVRGASLLIRRQTNTYALGPFQGQDGGRVVHSGKDFEKKLQQLLTVVIKRIPCKAEIEKFGMALESYNLKLGYADSQRRQRQIATLLCRKKLPLHFAIRVVSGAVLKGRNEELESFELQEERNRLINSRTAYDLFVNLMSEAKDLDIEQREFAEQAAYGLLMGKVTI